MHEATTPGIWQFGVLTAPAAHAHRLCAKPLVPSQTPDLAAEDAGATRTSTPRFLAPIRHHYPLARLGGDWKMRPPSDHRHSIPPNR